MRVVIRGHWANTVGTDYCEALGTYDSLDSKDALGDAEDYAWSIYEEPAQDEDDEEYEDEGPEYWLEEYDPETHDSLKAGGGSFKETFKKWEKDFG